MDEVADEVEGVRIVTYGPRNVNLRYSKEHTARQHFSVTIRDLYVGLLVLCCDRVLTKSERLDESRTFLTIT